MAKITIASTHHLSEILSDQVALCMLSEMQFRVFECDNSFFQADEVLKNKRVDVLIAYVTSANQLQHVRNIIHHYPKLKVVITGVNDRDVIFEYIQLGVKGHLGDDISEELLKRAIKVLHQGEVWFDREVSAKVLAMFIGQSAAANYSASHPLLSDREMEVMECVSRGMKNKAISETLFISESTVKTHLYKIYDKLGVKDRMSAVLKMKAC
ncbi:DNA-binding response regulator [Mariprofundus sp. EBB-1]|uniref:response regulator transcription factor n=1 Tax=Mariprofundus sp. EBB-1 TaxID=2650971 RepID=UPI000EF20F48|nr:response regulator transcription factor [Mariprofundus sp. EBB-1]RLL53684.1 DNA-binding response regulator [Mariprofundus sp. EBB-1]